MPSQHCRTQQLLALVAVLTFVGGVLRMSYDAAHLRDSQQSEEAAKLRTLERQLQAGERELERQKTLSLAEIASERQLMAEAMAEQHHADLRGWDAREKSLQAERTQSHSLRQVLRQEQEKGARQRSHFKKTLAQVKGQFSELRRELHDSTKTTASPTAPPTAPLPAFPTAFPSSSPTAAGTPTVLTPPPVPVRMNFTHCETEMTNQTLARMRRGLTSLLDEVTQLFVSLNIRHTVDGGTLLGFGRDKNFVPWEDDVDMRVHVDDWTKLLSGIRARAVKEKATGSIRMGAMRFDNRLDGSENYTGFQVTLPEVVLFESCNSGSDYPHLDVVIADLVACPLYPKGKFDVSGYWYGNYSYSTRLLCKDCCNDGPVACCPDAPPETYRLWYDVMELFSQPMHMSHLADVQVSSPPQGLLEAELNRSYGIAWREPDRELPLGLQAAWNELRSSEPVPRPRARETGEAEPAATVEPLDLESQGNISGRNDAAH